MKKYKPTRNNKGGRNLFCSHYSRCLDHAVKEGWDSWNCTKCDFKNKVCEQSTVMPVYSEDIAYYEFGSGFSSIDLDALSGI